MDGEFFFGGGGWLGKGRNTFKGHKVLEVVESQNWPRPEG